MPGGGNYKTVRIGKTVDYKTLENALLKAAKDLKLKINIEDTFCPPEYHLGSVKEVKKYYDTIFSVGNFLRGFDIRLNKEKNTNNFVIENYFISFSENKIKKYLEAVSQYL